MRKRLLAALCVCVLSLSGCGIRFPVLVPDNQSVAKFLSGFLSDQDGVSGSYTLSYVLSDEVKEKQDVTEREGTFQGNRKGISSIVSDDAAYYYDVKKKLLYEQTKDAIAVYSDGDRALDLDWWKDQLSVGNFKYGGKTDYKVGSDQKSVFLLDKTYSGDELASLLSHLHISFPGTVEAAKSDMVVTLYLDRFTGRLYSLSVVHAETGKPVTVIGSKNKKQILSEFHLEFLFSDYDVMNVKIPKEFQKIEPEGFPARLDASSMGSSGSVKDDVLVSEDGSFSATFGEHRVFDTLTAGESGTLVITSSQELVGAPEVTLSFVTGLNAYDSVREDAKAALSYYDSNGLSEILVDQDVMQTSVSGSGGSYPVYYYGQQYTETEFNYVFQEYVAYVALTDTVSLKCVLSGMTDRGVNGVINDAYFQSVLSCIAIEELSFE